MTPPVPPLLDRARLHGRAAYRATRRYAGRRVLVWLLEHLPAADLNDAVTTAHARRARRPRPPENRP